MAYVGIRRAARGIRHARPSGVSAADARYSDRLATRADAIKAINKRYEHYDFIDFITFEPDDEG